MRFLLLTSSIDNVDTCDCSKVSEENLRTIEADTYWCMSKFLDGIQVYIGETGHLCN